MRISIPVHNSQHSLSFFHGEGSQTCPKLEVFCMFQEKRWSYIPPKVIGRNVENRLHKRVVHFSFFSSKHYQHWQSIMVWDRIARKQQLAYRSFQFPHHHHLGNSKTEPSILPKYSNRLEFIAHPNTSVGILDSKTLTNEKKAYAHL